MTSTINRTVKNNKKAVIKKAVLVVALIFTSLFSFSQSVVKTITVTIDNVKNNNGKVIVSLHTEDTFMKNAGIMNAESEIKDGKVVITFNNVEPGEYAVMALHDENGNQRMDFQENGMPLESYGISNNIMSFGPPQYDDAKITVSDENLDLNIRF
ncbi:MAG: DUF2141 domain-containing protein [Winogradskyella sp.]|uniref:DUF2141 domain-containing protein n=1 Tax=Winogradskyella sp. TaxID=1883156 RepID=UPI00184117E7|nr:DUF2141 domain-containing protein [Winogradskyella sp.]